MRCHVWAITRNRNRVAFWRRFPQRVSVALTAASRWLQAERDQQALGDNNGANIRLVTSVDNETNTRPAGRPAYYCEAKVTTP